MQKIVLVILAIFLMSCSDEGSAETNPFERVKINDQVFEIIVRDTPEERAEGLMYRSELPENEGMWFVFDQEVPSTFWMKNTLIPLDIIWINSSYEIVDIAAAEPCPVTVEQCPLYGSKAPAQYVLELNQSVLKAEIGDSVTLLR